MEEAKRDRKTFVHAIEQNMSSDATTWQVEISRPKGLL